MIKINRNISIDENDLIFNFIRSSGPGGQNVNKVSTAVQLKFNIKSLPEDVIERLKLKAGKRISKSGFLLIESQKYRTQEKNKQDTINKLISVIKEVAAIPKTRKKTKPTKISSDSRLTEKKQKSEIKKYRKKITEND